MLFTKNKHTGIPGLPLGVGLFVLLQLIVSNPLFAQLNGTYTINSNSATTGNNFNSFTDLANALNGVGVSGPVTVYVQPGTGPYKGQVNLNQINGTSSSNTITIYGMGETITHTSSNTNAIWTLRLNGTDWLTINNLKINSGGIIYNWGIYFTNGADNNVIDSCDITCASANSGIPNINYSNAIVFSGAYSATSPSPTILGTNGYNNEIRNCRIIGNATGGWYTGICNYQNSYGTISANRFINNTIEDVYGYGFRTAEINGEVYSGNTIRRNNRTNSTSFYAFYNSFLKNTSISNNKIYNIFSKTSGSYIFYTIYNYNYAFPFLNIGGTNEITNNIVYGNHDYTFYFLYDLCGSYNLNIYHNTVSMKGMPAGAEWRNIDMDDYTTTNYSTNISNNVFDYNVVSGYLSTYYGVRLFTYSRQLKTSSNLWNVPAYQGGYFYYDYDGTNLYQLDDLPAAIKSGFEKNSIDTVPRYEDVNNGSLSLIDVNLDNLGEPVNITEDIEGNARSTIRPDIGAFEATLNVAVTDVKLPLSSDCEAAERDVTVRIENNSTFDQNKVRVVYQLGSFTPVAEDIPVSIQAGAVLTYTFKKKLKLPQGSHSLYAYLQNRSYDRDSFHVHVNASPLGYMLVKGDTFTGAFKAGSVTDPDVVASPDKVTYKLTPPTGFRNDDYGLTWEIKSLQIRTRNGYPVFSNDTSFVLPSASSDGRLYFSPSPNAADSSYAVSVQLISRLNGCVSPPNERNIYVAPRPKASFSAANICKGNTTSFINTSTINSGSVDYTWNFGNGKTSNYINPDMKFDATGIYHVTLKAISSYGYADSISIPVRIYENPTALFTYNNPCDGDLARFSNTSFSPNPGGLSYIWDFGDAHTSVRRNPQHAFAAFGGYKVSLTVTDAVGCVNTVSKNVYYSERPMAEFTVNSGGVACTGSTIYFTNMSQNGSGVGYEWDFGDSNASIGTHASHEYMREGNFFVKMISRNEFGCFKEKVVPMQVIKGVQLAYDATTCNGPSVSFSNKSVEFTPDPVTYTWNFGDGKTSSAKEPIHSYPSLGTFRVQLVASTPAGCITKKEQDILVGEKPVAFFSLNKTQICEGEEIHIQNGSYVSDFFLDYKWDLGNGLATLSETNPSVIYDQSGIYTIRLIATSRSSCSDTIEQKVQVSKLPQSSFKYRSSIRKSTFIFLPDEENGEGTYKWILGDGNTSNSKIPFEHQFPQIGLFKVCLIRDNNSCDTTTCKYLNVAGIDQEVKENVLHVYPNPTAGIFTIDLNGVAPEGQINIFNVLGEEVYSGKLPQLSKFNIDLNGREAGVYMVRIESEGEVYVQRISLVR